MRIKVSYSSSCHDSYHSGEQYGDWSESWDFEVTGVSIANEEGYEYSSEYFQIPDGSVDCYVLWMRYSTGDSFGRADGKGTILHAFGDAETAEKALNAFEAQRDSYSVKFQDENGREISISNPGAGYFEYIDSISVDCFRIGGFSKTIKF